MFTCTYLSYCLKLDFENCVYDFVSDDGHVDNVFSCVDENEDFLLDDDDHEDVDTISQFYEFIEVPSFVALISFNTNEPVYILKVLSKGIADKRLKDQFGHVILPNEYYIKGMYTYKKTRSKHPKTKKFKVLNLDVYISPDEVFDHFLEIDDDLCMDAAIY